MDIMTFNIIRENLLQNLTPIQADLAKQRIQLVLDLLGTETMSKEGMAIIITTMLPEEE